jgi:hypothetical protein
VKINNLDTCCEQVEEGRTKEGRKKERERERKKERKIVPKIIMQMNECNAIHNKLLNKCLCGIYH